MTLQILLWILLFLLWYVAGDSIRFYRDSKLINELKYDNLIKWAAAEWLQDKLTKLAKRDNPRITADMMKQQIIQLREQGMTWKQIWITLWFDYSTVYKALKKRWVK